MARNTRTIPIRIPTLMAAMRNRNVPETSVPTTLVVCCSAELPSRTWLFSARMPKLSSTSRANTTLEWPSEKKNPTDSGRLPSPTSLRVVLSMAAMWSASKACRMPSV